MPGTPRRERLLAAAAATGCGVFAALLALRPIAEPDLFWHLAVGRYVATEHRLPTTNLWSFTAPDHPFLASSWLFDFLAHGLYGLGGSGRSSSGRRWSWA